MEIKKFSGLGELFRTYCKACDDDEGVHDACEHLVETFKAALTEVDPLAAFIAQLKEDASYASWKPK